MPRSSRRLSRWIEGRRTTCHHHHQRGNSLLPVVSASVFSIREDIPQVLLQIAFLAAVPGAWSFVTLGSIGVSCLSFLFASFAKRNLRDGINADVDVEPNVAKSGSDGDGAGPVASSSDVELTVEL